VALALILLPALPSGAATLLLSVSETEAGQPSAPPLAAREGILATLFDGEVIAFEVPADAPPAPVDAMLPLAAEAGADTLAMVVVDWHREHIAGGALRISARGSIVLVDVLTGRETARVPFEMRNDGRELAVDSAALGAEIGVVLIGILAGAP
jgi:hypothetical protein